ncbi:MAG: hypothetical protein ACRDZQ_07835 [Acidimicrobiales bacterium]
MRGSSTRYVVMVVLLAITLMLCVVVAVSVAVSSIRGVDVPLAVVAAACALTLLVSRRPHGMPAAIWRLAKTVSAVVVTLAVLALAFVIYLAIDLTIHPFTD